MESNSTPSASNTGKEDIYARRVVVPIANPNTAPQLIRFAASLAHPEKGKVKALFINLPDSKYPEAKEKLTKVVKLAQDQEIPVELVTVNASNVARGVLDGARETNADLLVLGFQAPRDGKVVFGSITEAVARVSPTDLIVYRHTPRKATKRVVVPVTDLEGTEIALHHAAHIASYHNAELIAMYVETNTPTPFWRENAPPPIWQQMSMLEMAINDEPYCDQVKHVVVKDTDFVSGIVAGTTTDDIIMLNVQFRQNTIEQKWLFGATAQKMLRLSPGSVALIKRVDTDDDNLLQRVGRQIARWTPTLTLGERSDVIEQAGDLVKLNTNFIVMITISSVLASIGLLQNSAAVIIGAMLVAPLMSPLMGFGVGLAIGELNMMRRSFQTVMQGVFIVLATSWFIGFVSSANIATSEMLARGEPTFLDMMVALASGAAGSFALARRDVPAALAGVAIAAALVPPICTTGLAIAVGDADLAIGAGTLTLVNIVCISLAAGGVFALLGIRRAEGIPTVRRIAMSVILLILLALPLGHLLYQANQESILKYETEQVIESQFEGTTVTDIEIEGEDVTVTVQSRRDINLLQMVVAQNEIEKRTDRDIRLHLVVLNVVEVTSEED